MANIFEQLLQERNVSAYAVAKATGISQSTLADWRKGRCIPKADKLIKIANYFGVSVPYLLGEEKKPVPEDELKIKNVKFIGRDGTVKFKKLTPEMISMLEQLPDSDEDL